MAKKFGKILLLTAAVGSAAAAAYYYMQKKAASQAASEAEDYDIFTEDKTEPQNAHSYVSLTPDTKSSEEKESASDAADSAAASPSQDTADEKPGFTPLFQQLSQICRRSCGRGLGEPFGQRPIPAWCPFWITGRPKEEDTMRKSCRRFRPVGWQNRWGDVEAFIRSRKNVEYYM